MGKISEMGPAGPQGNSQDVLTEIIRNGAQRLLAEALEIEVEEFVARFKGLKDNEDANGLSATVTCPSAR